MTTTVIPGDGRNTTGIISVVLLAKSTTILSNSTTNLSNSTNQSSYSIANETFVMKKDVNVSIHSFLLNFLVILIILL